MPSSQRSPSKNKKGSSLLWWTTFLGLETSGAGTTGASTFSSVVLDVSFCSSSSSPK